MASIKKAILEWFGYSRRERRATFILLIILVVVVSVPYFISTDETDPEDLSYLLNHTDSVNQSPKPISHDTALFFRFDPNSSSYDTLMYAGLTSKQATTIINYRNKGGRFNKPEEIRKIYGIDEKTAARIIPFIDTHYPSRPIRKSKSDSSSVTKPVFPINLNEADSVALDKLPGIGPVLSSRIVRYRKILGGFVSVDQLREVYGLKDTTFRIIAGKVFVDSAHIIKIDINQEVQKDLERHPYLNKYDIQSIIKYRELKGVIRSTEELVDNKILTVSKAKKISPYLKF